MSGWDTNDIEIGLQHVLQRLGHQLVVVGQQDARAFHADLAPIGGIQASILVPRAGVESTRMVR